MEFDESFERTGYGEVDASFDLIRVVAGGARCRRRRRVPGAAVGQLLQRVGVVAGLGEPHPGVVSLDTHSDFNSPDTAISGYFDGMGLAVLTGGAWPALHATVPGGRPLPETSVVLAGACDFEPPEPVRLAASDLRQVDAADMAKPDALLDAIRSLEPQPTGIYLHLDLDVLNADVAGVNVFSAPGGPYGDQLAELIGAVCNEFPVRAVSLTAYDPGYDPDGRVPPIAMAVLRRVAAMSRRQGLRMPPPDQDEPPTPSGVVEPRWPVALAILGFITVSVSLRIAVPEAASLGPRWLVPSVEVAMLVTLLALDSDPAGNAPRGAAADLARSGVHPGRCRVLVDRRADRRPDQRRAGHRKRLRAAGVGSARLARQQPDLRAALLAA